MAFCSMRDGYSGRLPRAPGNKNFFTTTNDYLTKWVEAEPLAHIRGVDMNKFICNNILSQFVIPRALVSDNRIQFMGKSVKNMVDELKKEFYNSTPSYPRCNWQTEVSNKTIICMESRRSQRQVD